MNTRHDGFQVGMRIGIIIGTAIVGSVLLTTSNKACAQWYNTIDQQQQNAVIQSNQEALIRQQAARRELEIMNERALQELRNRQHMYDRHQFNHMQQYQQYNRGY